MARRASKMPWHAKPFFGGGRSKGWHVPPQEEVAEETPAWVPAGYDIWIEPRVLDGFATGRAWVNGTGIVPITDLLGADANTDEGAGPTQFTPSYLSADGYTIDEFFVAFIGAARTMLLAGATTRLELANCSPAAAASGLLLVSADGNDGVQVLLRPGGDPESGYVRGESWNGSFSEVIAPQPNSDSASQVLACTLTSTRGELSVNGSTPANVAVLDTSDWPTSGENAIVATLLTGSNLAFASIGIKQPVASASLPALSIVP